VKLRRTAAATATSAAATAVSAGQSAAGPNATDRSDGDAGAGTGTDLDPGLVALMELLDDMTIEEKVAQLGGVWSTQLVEGTGTAARFSPAAAARLMAHGTGQVTRIAASTGLRPAGIARLHNQIQRWLMEETRLAIPAIVHEEAVGGLCARDATQFPQAIGLAATFDTRLIEEVAAHIRSQMLAVGARQALSPVLDVARDPRWGRVEETYGEDPVLAGALGSAYVRGLQGTSDGVGLSGGVLATAKHFLGYAASDGGLNHGPANIGSRELREVHAEPFAAAIRDAGLESAMCSYASIDGLAPAGSWALLTELLREELGFAGTVVADYFAVDLLRTHHRVAPTKGVAGAKAITAGMDIELPTLDCFAMENLGPLVEAEVVPMEVVDRAVLRVLRQKLLLGLFGDPYVDEEAAPAAFGTLMGARLARRAAEESIVLLDDDAGLVPVDRSGLRVVAVVGPAADDVRLLEGDYHYPAHLEILGAGTGTGADLLPRAGGAFEPGPWFPDSVTPAEGLRRALGEEVEVRHAVGCGILPDELDRPDDDLIEEAVHLAAGADLAVVCVGGRSGLTPDATVGEARDATDLGLTGRQVELLARVAATGVPTVAVVLSGRVHTLAEVEAAAGATLLAWLPGEAAGTALAAVLLGDVAPSGRLPVSLPRHVGQVPVHHAPRAGGGRSQFWGDYTDSPTTPLHPFGYGLSTTTFTYDGLEVSPGSTTEPTEVSVRVTNTGPRTGTEVVQLYARDEVASVARPERQLVGFARVALDAGESRRVAFRVHPSRLAFFDEEFDFVCEPGAFDLEVGGWAGEPALRATVDLDGEVELHHQRDVVATEVTIT
jgi:beta-glucosidase